jgi:hypothetical protein
MRRFVATLVAAVALGACGGGGGSSAGGGAPAAIAVYALLGSLQCSGGGSTAGELQQQLIARGIEVIEARCGLDGVPRPALCGVSDGRIAVFDLAEAHALLALAIGFTLLSTLPNATVSDC